MHGSDVHIRLFQRGDEAAFRSLNEEWITRYFRVEAKDETTFADPQGTIIDRGGQILFATAGGDCVGCCALLRTGEKVFEVAKMAVSPQYQGTGIGRRLLLAAIEEGRCAGAQRLYLETNHTLTPAIRLYESVGFVPMGPDHVSSSPYARADVFMELHLI